MTTGNNKTHIGRLLSYWVAALLLLMVLAELLTARFYYQQYGKRKMALREAFVAAKEGWQTRLATKRKRQQNYQNQQRARPDSSAAWNQLVYDEMIAANHFIYDPWVGFRNKNFAGKTLHTQAYERRTIPATAGAGSDTLRVWMLGGSTMFGFNVADGETIPSQLAQRYAQTPICNRSLQVRNFGIPYFYSYQEYRLLNLLLEQEPPPHIVVFMDGLNDLSYSQTAPRWRHFFYHRMAHFMDPAAPEWEPAPATAALSDSMVRQYQKTITLIRKLSQQNNIDPLFIIQPVPFYRYPNQATDAACSKSTYPAYAIAYPALEKMSENQLDMFFWGNLLQQAPAVPFIDEIHYSPAFNQQMAGLLYHWLQGYLRERNCK